MSSTGGHCKSCSAHQTGVLPKPGAYDWHALEGLHGIAPNDSVNIVLQQTESLRYAAAHDYPFGTEDMDQASEART
jgi:hypothetical protein